MYGGLHPRVSAVTARAPGPDAILLGRGLARGDLRGRTIFSGLRHAINWFLDGNETFDVIFEYCGWVFFKVLVRTNQKKEQKREVETSSRTDTTCADLVDDESGV